MAALHCSILCMGTTCIFDVLLLMTKIRKKYGITSPPAALLAAASSELVSMTRRGSTSRYSAHQGVQGYTLPICNTTAASLPANARPKPHDDLAASARLPESIPGFALECRRFAPEKRGFAPGSNRITPEIWCAAPAPPAHFCHSCRSLQFLHFFLIPAAWRRGRRSSRD
ncbi:hypothetical protein SB6095_05223 [Klebsiella quasivariicola]|nr:hypothetical protein SB6095_05223 [Klebsiella quasivariicola]